MARLCFVAPMLGLGGAERSLVKLVNILARHGYTIDVITFLEVADNIIIDELSDQIAVHSLGGRRSANPRLWFDLRLLLRRLGPDIVIGWSLYANLVCCIVTLLAPNWRLVLCERIYWPQMLRSRVSEPTYRVRLTIAAIRYFYPIADVITANSRANLTFMKRFLDSESEFILLSNSIDMDDAEIRSNLSVDDLPLVDGPRILALARLDYQKGLDVLLDAFAQVSDDFPWSLVIVGEGPEKDRLQAQAVLLGIETSVYWLGKRSNPFPYYAWADLVVVPSRFEGFPNVPLEAMACGKMVICTNCKTGPRELTENGRFGRLVSVGDVDELSAALSELGVDLKECRRLGHAAKEHVRRLYGSEALSKDVDRIFGPSRC